MQRPVRFEHTRYLGDKRTQLVYDLDEWEDKAVIDDIIAAETGLCFGPDTLRRGAQPRLHARPAGSRGGGSASRGPDAAVRAAS